MHNTAAIAAVAAIAGAGGAWAGVAASASSAGSGGARGSPTATSLAPVVRTTLTAQTTVPGTVGYDGAVTVVLPGGTNVAALGQAQQKVTADTLAVGAAQTAEGDTVAAADQAVGDAQDALTAAQAVVAADRARLEGDQTPAATAADDQTLARDQGVLDQAASALRTAEQHATQSEHQAEAQLAEANAALNADQSTLGLAEQSALNPGTTFTRVPAPGAVIAEGQALYALDGRPVPLLYGSTTAWRAFAAGMADGPDVAQLNDALVALGFEASSSAGAHFSDATTAGVSRLEGALGLPQTGTLHLGDVVFASGPLQIASVAVHPGSPAQPGSTVLDASSTALVVTAQVPLSEVGSVKPGDAVAIDLPNGQNGVPGHVRAVGASVTSPNTGSGTGSGSGNGNGQGATTVDATMTFSDPSVATGLDQAAVLVHVTTATADDVLAVPVDALLALGEGGEGVEVVTNGVHRIVAVHVGLFTGTQVEVDGAGLGPGVDVVVPTS